MTNKIEIDYAVALLRKMRGQTYKMISETAVEISREIEDLEEDVKEMEMEEKRPNYKINQVHSELYNLKKNLALELALATQETRDEVL